MSGIFKLSSAGGVTSKQRYPNMLTNYGDFGALQRIGYATVSGSTNSVTFSSIPQIYQDLMLICYSRSAQAVASPQIYIYENSEFTTNRSCTYLVGNGSAASSSRITSSVSTPSGFIVGASATSGIFASTITHILNYANTTTYKTSFTRSAADLNGSGYTTLNVKLYPSASAITSLFIANDSNNNWVAGSTFELFGVKASAS